MAMMTTFGPNGQPYILRKKDFVYFGKVDDCQIEDPKPEEEEKEKAEDGLEIKEFYKSIISQPSTAVKKRRTIKRSKPNQQSRIIKSTTTISTTNDNQQLTPSSSSTFTSTSNEVKEEPYYCDTCKENIEPKIPYEQHIRSVVHLLAEQVKPPKSYYLNETNKGFKMLKAMHWHEDEGLGVGNRGVLDPIKTQLKMDKTGLGLRRFPWRVTHFKPNEIPDTKKDLKRIRASNPDIPPSSRRMTKPMKKLFELRKKLREQKLREAVYH